MTLISAPSSVRYEVLGKTECVTTADAIRHAEVIFPTREGATAVFTRIVIARATIERDPNTAAFHHQLAIWDHDGPCSIHQFLDMLRFDNTLSPQAWHTRMEEFRVVAQDAR